MKTIQVYQAALPLLKGRRIAKNQVTATTFLGSATVIGEEVCTCKHVIESVDFSKEVVLSKWNLQGKWVVFTGASLHPRFDFAVLRSSERPPFDPLPLYEKQLPMGTTLYAAGYHYDGVTATPHGQNVSLAPRAFFGNVVRVFELPSNHSPAVCELSFPTLSGFSGAPLISADFSTIFGMVYGNVEQSIRVHSKYEVRDNKAEFSETVNRILELGLFHTSKDIKSLLAELNAA